MGKRNKAKRRKAAQAAEKAGKKGGATTCLCEHVEAIDKNVVKKIVNKLKYDYFKCPKCDDWEEDKLDQLLICMTCGELGCNRSMNGHSLEHHEESTHPIFLNSEGMLWCHKCDDFLSNRGFNKWKQSKQVNKVVNNFKQKVRQFANKLKKARLEAEKKQFEPVFVDEHISKGSDEAPIVGLNNQGNTCYFNSIMQNLAEARCMRSAFASVGGPSGKMKKVLSKFIEDMWTTRQKSIKPTDLLDTMASYNSNLAGRRQQDAYECFQSITRGLEAESAKKKKTQENRAAKELACKIVSTWTADDVIEWLQSHDVVTKGYVEEFELDDKDLITGEDVAFVLAMKKGSKTAAAKLFNSRMGFCPKQKNWQQVKEAWNDLKHYRCPFFLKHREEYLEAEKAANGEDGTSEEEPESEGERFDDVTDYKPKEVLQHVFGGLLDSSVRCLTCNHVSRHYEKFYDISLPIEPAITEQLWGRNKKKKKKTKRTKKGKEKSKQKNAFSALMDDEDDEEEDERGEKSAEEPESSGLCGQAKLRGKCDVTDCLEAFTDPDLLFGDNAYRCIECTRKVFPDYEEGSSKQEMISSSAHVRYQIARPPRILALHLKRFTNQGFRTQKCGKKVSYPFELDLAPYMSEEMREKYPNTKYHLYGVSVHSGGMNGGHYIAYVHKRRTEGEQNGWYYFSDATARPASYKSAMNAQAYMLFYEQVDGVDTWESAEGAPEAVTGTNEDSKSTATDTREGEVPFSAVPGVDFAAISGALQQDDNVNATINSFLGSFLQAEGIQTEETVSSTAEAVIDDSYSSVPVDSEWSPGLYEIIEESFIMDHINPKHSDPDDWMEIEVEERFNISEIVQFENRIRGKTKHGWITMYKINQNKRFVKKVEDGDEIDGAGRDEQERICGAEDCAGLENIRPSGPEETV